MPYIHLVLSFFHSPTPPFSLCVSIRLPTSGSYDVSSQDLWITNSTLAFSSNDIGCSPNTAVCVDCLSAYDSSTMVCWNPGTSSPWFPSGVNVSMGAFCNACPSGCGPFRSEKREYFFGDLLTISLTSLIHLKRKAIFISGFTWHWPAIDTYVSQHFCREFFFIPPPPFSPSIMYITVTKTQYMTLHRTTIIHGPRRRAMPFNT